MDRIRAMQIFSRVAELGSFRRVAEEFGLSHGMASAIVTDLEQHLGVPLLRRSTRRLHLTDEGSRYLERARILLDDLTELEDEIGGGEKQPKGVLRIHAPVGFSRVVLAPVLGQFLANFPDLTIQLLSRNTLPDFVGDNLDIAIFIGDLPDSHLVAHPLGLIPLPILAAPSYLEAAGTPETLDDLARHNCIAILSSVTNRQLDWRFQVDGRFVERIVSGNMVFENSEAAIAAAISGAGLVQMIGFLVSDEIRRRTLRPVLLNHLYSGPAIHFLIRRQRHVPRKVRVFEAFLRQEIREGLKDFDLDAVIREAGY